MVCNIIGYLRTGAYGRLKHTVAYHPAGRLPESVTTDVGRMMPGRPFLAGQELYREARRVHEVRRAVRGLTGDDLRQQLADASGVLETVTAVPPRPRPPGAGWPAARPGTARRVSL